MTVVTEDLELGTLCGDYVDKCGNDLRKNIIKRVLTFVIYSLIILRLINSKNDCN